MPRRVRRLDDTRLQLGQTFPCGRHDALFVCALPFSVSEAARREVLDRLHRLNHERHAQEVEIGLLDGSKKKANRAPARARNAAGGQGARLL